MMKDGSINLIRNSYCLKVIQNFENDDQRQGWEGLVASVHMTNMTIGVLESASLYLHTFYLFPKLISAYIL
jgi:hypothetical protein